jgi:hypothetical protein
VPQLIAAAGEEGADSSRGRRPIKSGRRFLPWPFSPFVDLEYEKAWGEAERLSRKVSLTKARSNKLHPCPRKLKILLVGILALILSEEIENLVGRHVGIDKSLE